MTSPGGPGRPPTGRVERLVDPVPASASPARRPAAVPAPVRERAPRAAALPSTVAGRFRTAAAALGCVGGLIAIDRAEQAEIRTGDGTWWVLATVDLDLGRAVVHSADGVTYVGVDGWLVRDRGFGGPPSQRPATGAVDPETLGPVSRLELVRAGGLHPTRPQPMTDAVLLLPGFTVTTAVRRALDLGLDVTHRVVGLSPLFSGTGDDGGETTLIQVRLHSHSGPIPPTLLSAIARYPLSAVCRAVWEDDRLLVQHTVASPLPDQQLAALVAGSAWVFADPAFGCWRLEPRGDWVRSAGLARLDAGFDIVEQSPQGTHDTITPAVVRLVPARLPGQRVDAVLLDEADLANATLLLEHHPLGEVAVVVSGADRHLLLAAGGLLDTFAIGEPLVCVGPGPLYLPLGRRLSPRLPPSARQAVYEPDEEHAVVVTEPEALRFPLAGRRPAWRLWVGEPPAVEPDLPADAVTALRALDQPDQPTTPAPQPRQRRPWPFRRRTAAEPARSWRDDALDFELANELVKAAELHRRHHEPLRAAHLFERAAQQAAEERTRS